MVEVNINYTTTEISSQELGTTGNEKFDFKKLEVLLSDITADLSDIKPEPFWDFLIEFVKIIKEISSALSLGFQCISRSLYFIS